MSADLLPAPPRLREPEHPWIAWRTAADGSRVAFALPTSTYCSAMTGLGIRRALAHPAVVAADGAEPTSQSAAAHRRGLVKDLGLPDALRRRVVEAYAALCDGAQAPVLVRQLDGTGAISDRAVVGADAVVDAIVDAWASLWDSAMVDRQRRGEVTEPAAAVEVVRTLAAPSGGTDPS